MVIMLIFVEICNVYLIVLSNLGWVGSRRFKKSWVGLVGSICCWLGAQIWIHVRVCSSCDFTCIPIMTLLPSASGN